MQANFKNVTYILAALLLVSACTDKKEQPTIYAEANQLMDKGAFSQSIALLEPEVLRAPGDQEARKLLAASYAGRAGIYLNGYIKLSNEITKTAESTEQYFASSQGQGILSLKNRTSDPDKKRSLQFVESIYKAMIRLNNFLIAFASIPAPTTVSGERDLETAIAILAADNHLTGGDALYRGLLRTSQLKVDLRDAYKFDSLFSCDADVRNLRSQLLSLQRDLDAILSDFMLATLSSSTERKVKELSKKINRDISQVIMLLDGVGDGQAESALLIVQQNVMGQCR